VLQELVRADFRTRALGRRGADSLVGVYDWLLEEIACLAMDAKQALQLSTKCVIRSADQIQVCRTLILRLLENLDQQGVKFRLCLGTHSGFSDRCIEVFI
jgi:hypothetical protein